MLYQRQAVITWPFHVALEELGGYLVESNQGHFADEGMGATADWELFGASAESALYSKKLAAEMYGQAPRHGYIWGPSGGGFRTMMCIENRPDVWDGASPHVTGAGIAPSYSAAVVGFETILFRPIDQDLVSDRHKVVIDFREVISMLS